MTAAIIYRKGATMYRLVIAFAVAAMVTLATRADDDAVKAKFDEAKKQYREQMEKMKRTVLDALDKKEAQARENGDKKAVDQIKAELVRLLSG